MRPPTPLPHSMAAAPFTVRAALDAGVTARRVRSIELVAPFHGVRASRRATDTFLGRCRAYAAIMPTGHVFSGRTAAVLCGLPLPAAIERDGRVEVTALEGARAPRRRGVIGRSTRLNPNLVAAPGVPGAFMTAPADAWCELADVLSLDDLIAAGERLLGLPRPLATTDQIDATIARHGRRRGATRLRLARAEMRANVYSRRETFVRLMLVRAGLPEPEPNGLIVLRSGRRTRGDLVFRAYRVLVEYDGEQHLFDTAQWATDVSRLNDLAEADWRVIRITKQISRAEIVARTERALRDRGWRG
ncbi:hypothetical protein ACFSEO_02870 [Agromyces cerinus subsp. nitratus]|uniref:hypothetical protein n=1 Tax=Agromyces cerinus TaxID=33878 RepID=UPI003630981F